MCFDYLSLDEIKKIEFDLLKNFSDYCEVNNLSYSLTYGTLLGAVRHKGFIPWDDDIDVMMPREDYEKFVFAFSGNSPIKGCELLHRGEGKEYYYPFAKLCDESTVAKMEDNNTEHGIWIDIFPVDHVPDDEKAAKEFHRHIRFYKNMIISYTTDFCAKNKTWKTIPKFIFAGVTRMVGIEKIVDYIEEESIKYNKSSTNRISVVSWQSSEGGNMLEKDFFNLTKVEFNGVEFRCIDNYDTYLTSIYGNYMNVPPEGKRTTHHILAYRK